MKYPNLYLVLLLLLFMNSCVPRYAYFQSPFQSTTSSYKAIPMKADSLRSAVYASGLFTIGGANQHLRDGITAFSGSIHRSHHFGPIQGYYGVTGSLGKYKVDNFIPQSTNGRFFNNNLNDSLLNNMAGNKFFGGWGFTGGVNAVVPFRGRHEWRVFGVEAAWQKEFGDYLDFRKQLPDTAANLIDQRDQYFTLAFSTDIVWRVRRGSIGLKSGYTTLTRSLTRYGQQNNSRRRFTPGFWSETIHFETRKVTGFWQFNLGSYTLNMQAGLNYRLGR
jgi:hypothetical protein